MARKNNDLAPASGGRAGRERYFFGRRKAKPLSQRQEAVLRRLLPGIGIEPHDAAVSAPHRLFPVKTDAVMLEIGFGGGEHLIEEASCNPRTGFIGVEPFVNGLARTLAEIEARGLFNIRVFTSDAAIMLDELGSETVLRVDLLFPDPWPKRRHWKRRFVNSANLDRIERVLMPGGLFRFVSDDADYVNWTLHHSFARPALVWTAACADDWRVPWEGWHPTRYEHKARRQGRTPSYLVFQKRNAA